MHKTVYISGSDLARKAGVSRQAITKAAAEGRLPRLSDGRFDASDPNVRAYISDQPAQRPERADLGREKASSVGAGRDPVRPRSTLGRENTGSLDGSWDSVTPRAPGVSATDRAEADLRWRCARADVLELKRGELCGHLLEHGLVADAFSRLAVSLDAELRALDEREGPDLFAAARSGNPATFQAALHDRINAALDRVLATVKREILAMKKDYKKLQGKVKLDVNAEASPPYDRFSPRR